MIITGEFARKVALDAGIMGWYLVVSYNTATGELLFGEDND